ncbi:phosphoribosylformylglycinamidine synthase [Gemmatimonas aurantiaca T-27]|uniref:Phosphoribosylformylglycinamidine synthase subunit PurS n=1 Tax=Gemmatimonas aurantiaca (strain DSM 14586 / JCM 11422 / NBRC 100505 / T-27) TaxID=379066 RepID=C1A3V2_GEMAT|nr:phosphoribosylformylglycinamidine synthase subunit PurS [Gemmatimonas aurantiaca]BAH38777.1 phosphoribosylformylglycinamidine synthase [Gemmatimonas aurantiaca T-27]
MTRFRCAIHIVPRRGILDPQGKAVADALHSLGFATVGEVRVGRHVVVEIEAASEDAARDQVKAMCEKLLANPVTEDFEIASLGHA